ncbi:MAG: glycosyltransferase family 2 protein, partial [Clostridiales bacterium]|nr:glycosyltransferase family 2 protein [Clostridiales bacterium]
ADTIECLESLLHSTYHNYQIVVVDNDSTDNSLSYFKAWADGQLSLFINRDNPLKYLSWPHTVKPLTQVHYKQAELNLSKYYSKIRSTTEAIIFIETEKNRGYAAGNNIGLKWAAINDSFSYCWVLNNDTIVTRDCLKQLVSYAQDNHLAITGATLLDYHKPHAIQSLGGHLNKFFGTSYPLKVETKLQEKLDYIEGASFFIDKDCLNSIGFFLEEYFLFFEEVDYCFRARHNHLQINTALKATVFHKAGSSPENQSKPQTYLQDKNEFRDLLALENRIRFSRKYLHNRLGLKLGLVISAIIRIKRKQFQRAWQIIRKLFN